MAAKTQNTTEIKVAPLLRGTVNLRIVGTTPLFQNRMSEKAKQYFLAGGSKKTKADKAGIKHDPLAEFQSSAEVLPGGPTALGLRVVAIKSAMATAALETPGLTKTSAQRLLFLPGEHVALYGTPQLRIDVVREAGIARNPDMRTRCFLPKWGANIKIEYIIPQLSVTSVANMLCNAGILIGVGDFRQEKGKGSFGSFRVLADGQDDPEWNDLVKNHGRKAQEKALANPEYAAGDTADLMEFITGEVARRAA